MRLYQAVDRLATQAGEDAGETIDWLCGEHGGMSKLFEAYFSPKPIANPLANQSVASGSPLDSSAHSADSAETFDKPDIGIADPCPQCQRGGVCRTMTCRRLQLPFDHPYRNQAFALAQPEHPLDKKADNAREFGLDYEPEQNPVEWGEFAEWMQRNIPSGTIIGDSGWWAIYSCFIQNIAPQKHELKDLTKDQIAEIFWSMPGGLKGFSVEWGWMQFSDALIAALKEKNAC